MFNKTVKNSVIITMFSLGWFGTVLAAPSDDFVTTWQTSKPNETITIPTTGGGYNYAIDWDNDGTFDQQNIMGNPSHEYKTAGKHTIRIKGDFPRIYIGNGGGRDKIVSIDQWGSGVWTSMEWAFWGASNLVINAKDNPNLSAVTNMTSMFAGIKAFNQDISEWNVSNVTNMSFMFGKTQSFNQDISQWDVSHVTNMADMFYLAKAFDQDIGDWDVSNVTTVQGMFSSGIFNQDIGQWNVSKVTHMGEMFAGGIFNQDIGQWNVSKVTNMQGMFYDAKRFNQDIGGWDVSNVTNMDVMFTDAKAFNQNIGGWNVSKVKVMTDMFKGANAFDQDLSAWGKGGITK